MGREKREVVADIRYSPLSLLLYGENGYMK